MFQLLDRPSRVSSPIQQTEELFAAEEVKKTSGKSIARSARLAALASQINQWEDDVKNVPTSSVKVVSIFTPLLLSLLVKLMVLIYIKVHLMLLHYF